MCVLRKDGRERRTKTFYPKTPLGVVFIVKLENTLRQTFILNIFIRNRLSCGQNKSKCCLG